MSNISADLITRIKNRTKHDSGEKNCNSSSSVRISKENKSFRISTKVYGRTDNKVLSSEKIRTSYGKALSMSNYRK